MLIITADDYGKNAKTTNNIILAYKCDRITTVSAMVFMRDSERAAEISLKNGVDTGLHLNFSQPFDGSNCKEKLILSQLRLAQFIEKNKYASIIYNPFLKNDFEYVYLKQIAEYVRLYGKSPIHFNGHRHKHLCSNILIDGLIPKGLKVRRSFTFNWREKNPVNILYRRIVDRIIEKRYACTDYFYSIAPIENKERLKKIIILSRKSNVELMVHPELTKEKEYLMSDEFNHTISNTKTGTYRVLY